jgi:hypothetical protein
LQYGSVKPSVYSNISTALGGLWLYSCGFNRQLDLNRTVLEVVAETDSHELTTPEDWWTMVMGGGIRGTVEQLDTVTQERIRSVNLEFLRDNNIHALDSDVLYAIAQK